MALAGELIPRIDGSMLLLTAARRAPDAIADPLRLGVSDNNFLAARDDYFHDYPIQKADQYQSNRND